MKENLKKALAIVREYRSLAAVVFDLDSTLFCMKYRTEAIIRKLLESSEHGALPEAPLLVEKLKVTERDWSVEEIFSRYGLSPKSPFVQRIRKYWKEYFFTNHFLHLDRPYAGGVDYVWRLKKEGASIFYLTGRGQKPMGQGSLDSLKKWNFPLEKPSHLILKQNTKKEDALYKMEELKHIQSQFQTVLFFENEPVILNRIASEMPLIKLFWMDSTHSRKELPPEKALPIPMDYRLPSAKDSDFSN